MCHGTKCLQRWLLKLSYGALFIAMGADKISNMYALWTSFISPTTLSMIPLDMAAVIKTAGIIEIIIGIAIIGPFARLGAFFAMVWLSFFAYNLYTFGHPYSPMIAQNIALAIGALVLMLMSTCKKELPTPPPGNVQ
jgi:uncharacterized membrane protein YphA (DoxX/SURF4 family)